MQLQCIEMVFNTDRVNAAQRLRTLAAKHGVARVSDQASRQKVGNMAKAIIDLATVSNEERAEAESALAAFEATFAQAKPAAAEPSGALTDNQKEWKFQAVQLTYNSKVGAWASRVSHDLKVLFDRLVAFACELAVTLVALGVSVTLERSLSSDEHVHAHIYLHLEDPFRKEGRNALNVFRFDNIHPHLQTNTARGKAYLPTVRFGHFYVMVNKRGSLHAWSNFPPFEAYGVEGWWLDNLLKQGKLDRKEYLKLAARVTVGFQRRHADVQAAERFEQDLATTEAAQAEAAALSSSICRRKSFDVVDTFVAAFGPGPKHRRPILAIVGGTNLGKSLLAASVLRSIAWRAPPNRAVSTPPTSPVTAAAASLKMAKGQPRKDAETNAESIPVWGVEIRNPIAAPSLDPSFLRPRPAGITPQEHSGRGTPSITPFSTPNFPRSCVEMSDLGSHLWSNAERMAPKNSQGARSRQTFHIAFTIESSIDAILGLCV